MSNEQIVLKQKCQINSGKYKSKNNDSIPKQIIWNIRQVVTYKSLCLGLILLFSVYTPFLRASFRWSTCFCVSQVCACMYTERDKNRHTLSHIYAHVPVPVHVSVAQAQAHVQAHTHEQVARLLFLADGWRSNFTFLKREGMKWPSNLEEYAFCSHSSLSRWWWLLLLL